MCAGSTLALKLHSHALLIACSEEADVGLLSTFSSSEDAKLGFTSKGCLRDVSRGNRFGYLA